MKSPPRRVGGAPHAVGSQAARGARPCDVRHHELEVKTVELGVCFSLWGGGGDGCLGAGTAEPPVRVSSTLRVCSAGERGEGVG